MFAAPLGGSSGSASIDNDGLSTALRPAPGTPQALRSRGRVARGESSTPLFAGAGAMTNTDRRTRHIVQGGLPAARGAVKMIGEASLGQAQARYILPSMDRTAEPPRRASIETDT